MREDSNHSLQVFLLSHSLHRLGYEKLKPHPLFLFLDFTLFYFAFIIIIIIYGLEDFFHYI